MSFYPKAEGCKRPDISRDLVVRCAVSIAKAESLEYPGASFLAGPFAGIDSETTFERGLVVLLDGIESWRTIPASSCVGID